jgi:hypothetical protein
MRYQISERKEILVRVTLVDLATAVTVAIAVAAVTAAIVVAVTVNSDAPFTNQIRNMQGNHEDASIWV